MDRLKAPKASNIFHKIALIQLSSAATERVFSLFQNSFGKRQEHLLEDHIQLPVMMQHNHGILIIILKSRE